MMKLIALFGAPGGIWWVIGISVALLAAGGTGGYIARGVIDAPIISHQETLTAQADGRTKECVASHEKARADGAEKALSGLALSISDAAESVDNLSRKAAARGKTLDQFLKELANAPPSKVCGTVAAELAYRHSVVRPDGPVTTP